jgi:molybdate transport system ATP-binding protein
VARGVSRAVPAARRLERIEIDNASVRLGRHWALRDVSLDLRVGERWLLLGPNGAGKTVLLKLLRGDVWPTPTGHEARRYHLRDGEVLEQPLFASHRIAYLGPERQDRYLRHESTLDVAQVVHTGFDDSDLPLQVATPAQRRRIETVLRQVGLAGLAKRKILTLSYGQRRRVLLARAFVREPDVLLLDEALNGLDAHGRAAFLRALRLASSPRTAWVLTSHRRNDAPPGLTHIARIAHGVIASVTDLRACIGDPATTRSAARPKKPSLARREARPEGQPEVVQASQRNTRGTRPRIRSTKPLLRLQRAAVYRDERAIIGKFDWTLERGQHWFLRGANGSGKSTFVAMLYGDLWPAHGGNRQRQWPAADDWKARVGLVSPELQARYAATGCTVEQIVASGFHASIGLNDRPTPGELRRVRRELRAWGLKDFATRQARELSYGQLRLALVARAFVRARRLWLLDEPFDGLDAATRQRLRARLDEAVARGATMVLATHHEDDVPAYVQHVLTLRRGRAPVVSER